MRVRRGAAETEFDAERDTVLLRERIPFVVSLHLKRKLCVPCWSLIETADSGTALCLRAVRDSD